MQSFELGELLDTASTSFQVKIKETLRSAWENPSLNKQVNHANLTLSFLFSVLNTYCFSAIVFSSALHSRCFLVFIYSIKLPFISHRLAAHLYSQLMMDVDHPKHVLQT